MTDFVINSDESLQTTIGAIRDEYHLHRYLRLKLKTGKDRSLSFNDISHVWYQQLARELREYDALGWKSFCKYTFGLPILCAEDEDFRAACNACLRPLTYENRMIAMRHWPTTSLMTKAQLSKYLEMMQEYFSNPLRGVMLEFPKEEKS